MAGCHAQNRASQQGFGTFMTNRLGLCLLAVCVDKYKDAFCAKISQRLEKRALELGLKALIQKHHWNEELGEI